MHPQPPFASKPAVALGPGSPERDPVGPATGTRLDPIALARLRELDPTGANQLVQRVFKAFDTSTGRLLPLLEQAQRAGDHAAIGHVAHTLKSSSASVGALRLSELSAEVETMVRNGRVEGLPAVIEQMTRETAEVLKALKQISGGPP